MRRLRDEPEHDAFRDTVRAFCDKQIAPRHKEWEQAGIVDRSLWLEAGKQGLLGTDVPEEYGGGGVQDFRYNAVIGEEITRVGGSGVGFTLHNDVVAPYLLKLGTEE
jgi:acyl-CoA dehydrogenase